MKGSEHWRVVRPFNLFAKQPIWDFLKRWPRRYIPCARYLLSIISIIPNYPLLLSTSASAGVFVCSIVVNLSAVFMLSECQSMQYFLLRRRMSYFRWREWNVQKDVQVSIKKNYANKKAECCRNIDSLKWEVNHLERATAADDYTVHSAKRLSFTNAYCLLQRDDLQWPRYTFLKTWERK